MLDRLKEKGEFGAVLENIGSPYKTILINNFK